MTEISSVGSAIEDGESFSAKEESESRGWKKIEYAALSGAVFTVAFSFFPSAGSKKRIAIPIPSSISSFTLPLSETAFPEAAPLCSPAPKERKIPYADLYCTPKHQEIIGWIINTVAEGGLNLLWKKKMLDDLGEEIFPMHPYKFLSTILLDPHLNSCLRKIFKDPLPFKRMGFLGGVKRGMEREAANLETYIEEFAAEMGTTPKEIRPFIQASDWNRLVIHLLGKAPKRRN